MSATGSQEPGKNGRWKGVLARLGLVGFLFFLIKGILWLVLFYFGGSAVLKGCM